MEDSYTAKFPLYHDLLKDLPSRDLTAYQKRDFIKKVAEIDHNGHETMYALIKIHCLREATSPFVIPYSGAVQTIKHSSESRDITFELVKFPPKLRQLLYKFIKRHIKAMAEENERNHLHQGKQKK